MKSKNRKPVWLLSIASAYSLMSACGDDTDDPELMGVVSMPPAADAGVIDAGVRIRPPSSEPPLSVGLQWMQPRSGRSVDAGVMVTPPPAAPDAGLDAVLHSGVVVQTPDAG